MGSEHISFGALVIIATLAFLTPIVVTRIRAVRVPVVVGELLVGIVVGKSGFDIVQPEAWLSFLGTLGIAYLMFLSGVEIDFSLLRRLSRRPQGRKLFAITTLYFVCVLGAGLLAGYVFAAIGWVQHPLFVALILTTTSVGVVLPIIKEKRLSGTEYGQAILVTALLMDFATMLLLTALVTFESGGSPRELTLIALLFLAVFVAYVGGDRLRQQPFMRELAHATSQIGVRGAFMLIFIFAFLSEVLGVEVILGAFLAGAIVSLISERDDTLLHLKLDAIGFGFLVPIFFILVGAEFDAAALLRSPESLLLAPAIVVVAYVAKTLPGFLFGTRYGLGRGFAMGVLMTPGLSLTVAAAEIGFRLSLLSPATHSAILLLAIVTAALSPILFERWVPDVDADEEERLIVVGANERGMMLTRRLADWDGPVHLVDKDSERVAAASARGFQTVAADVRDVAAWRDLAPDSRTRVLLATQADDVNLAVAQILRTHFTVGPIIAHVNDPGVAEALERLDVRPVTPAFSTLTVMENLIRHPDLFALLNHESDDVAIQAYEARNPAWSGHPIRELPIPDGTLILAIRRGREHVIPRGETSLQPGDVLTLLGPPEQLEQAAEALVANSPLT